MPINNDNIKKALDSFENDDFISAKETIKKEINGVVSDFFKEKLDLQKDLGSEKTTDTETDTETDTDTDTDIDTDTDTGGSEN